MDIKEIAVFLKAGAPCEARLELTAALAQRHGAHVSAIWLIDPPEVALAECFAVGPKAVNAVIDARDASIAAMVEGARMAFERAVAGHAASYGWRQCALYAPPGERAEQAQLADLVIVEAPAPHDEAQRELVEALLFNTAAPCLLTPEGAGRRRSFHHAVIAWNGSRSAQRALGDALPLLREAASVSVLMVDERAGRRVDTAGEAQVLRCLSRHGVRAEAVRRPAGEGRAGAAILDACAELGADLLVMGAYGRSRTAEAVFGGATRTVLGATTLPVLLSR
ncbi:universal stress protein [Caulobacter sp. KR2-114]|uniref:universal stress protein n=1 Tax=Caulobacter sp. KR2-114 TaxID=3400912 RepID=UPI003C0CC8BD